MYKNGRKEGPVNPRVACSNPHLTIREFAMNQSILKKKKMSVRPPRVMKIQTCNQQINSGLLRKKILEMLAKIIVNSTSILKCFIHFTSHLNLSCGGESAQS